MAYIEVKELWKAYPGVWPLKGISFEVRKGRVVGVLGQNGSQASFCNARNSSFRENGYSV